MKKIFYVVTVLVFLVVFVGCTQGQAATQAYLDDSNSIIITHASGQTRVPLNPSRVAVFDMGILDTLDYLGLADNVLGTATASLPSYLSHLAHLPSLGTLHIPDVELLAELAPDLIIISGRARPMFDELSTLAPTIDLASNNDDFLNQFAINNRYMGQIFGLESEVNQALDAINARIDTIYAQNSQSNKRALIILHNEGLLRGFGVNSRFGIIHDVLGITAADPHLEVVNHGVLLSNEYIVELNPDILFVLDRNIATGGDAAPITDIKNELIQLTNAYQTQNIHFLDSELWYLAQGGLQGFGMQLDEIYRVTE